MDIRTVKALDLTYRGEVDRAPISPDCEIYYEIEGDGPCVTFVSTVYVVSTAWRNFTRRIANETRLLTYDLRNQGASTGTATEFEQHVSDLAALLDHVGVERTYLVGSSISTVICRDFAIRHPDRVAGLILVGPPFSPWGSKRRTRIMKSWLTTLEAGGPSQLFDAMYPLVFGDHAQAIGGAPTYLALRERFLAINSMAQLRSNLSIALETASDTDALPRVQAPTLLLAGDDDFCVSPSALRKLADIMPDARAEVFDDCGHLPFFENTERFERSLTDFVRDVEARPTNSAEVVRLSAHSR